MSKLNIIIPITKIDAETRTVYGVMTEEVPDKAGEIIDYESAKAEIQKWSDGIAVASDGKSLGNVRAMHGADLGPVSNSLFEYLSGWLGGPPLYSTRTGTVCLTAPHKGFAIGEAERDQWLFCMRRAMVEAVKGAGFTFVALDLEGFRSGALNEALTDQDRIDYE